tara:strand:+ start:2593 stop:3537 length:945 start_codon:yes stop_codon:yes gene_type:complete
MALRLRGATSGYIELKAPASAGDNTLTLPTNNGGANQLLKIDGSGNLSWQSNLTFDGSILTVTGAVGISTDLFHIGDDDTKITFTDNQIDLRTGNLSRIYLNNYALYVKSGFPFAFLASSGDSPNIKSGGTNAQDLLLTTGSGNPTRLQVGVGGDVTVNTGNLIIGTAGKGIDFSNQTASSATDVTVNGELLDHFEEGTWTPTQPTVGWYSGAEIEGKYQRVGHWVTATFIVKFATNGSAVQGLIDGLPFVSGGSGSASRHGGAPTFTTDSNVQSFLIGNSEARIYLFDGSGNAIQCTHLDDDEIRGTVIYRVA